MTLIGPPDSCAAIRTRARREWDLAPVMTVPGHPDEVSDPPGDRARVPRVVGAALRGRLVLGVRPRVVVCALGLCDHGAATGELGDRPEEARGAGGDD